MGFVPIVPESTYERMESMVARAHAQDAMAAAADVVLGYAAAHADYHADTWEPDPAGPYDLYPFLEGLRSRAYFEAARGPVAVSGGKAAFMPMTIAVPTWVNTARGAYPQIDEPDWVRVSEPVTPARENPPEFPNVAYAVAFIADGRRPSLLRADWDWCGVFPFGTPTYKRVFTEAGETRTCIAEPCPDEAEGQAAA